MREPAADITVTAGDTTAVAQVLTDREGDVVVLTDATVRFVSKPIEGGTGTVHTAELGATPAEGEVRVIGLGTLAPGFHLGEYEITFPAGGGVQSYPSGQKLLIRVTGDHD